MTDAPSKSNSPLMGVEFARVYGALAHRITGPISVTAVEVAAGIVPGTRVLDIAAGAGALSVPAAEVGASCNDRRRWFASCPLAGG